MKRECAREGIIQTVRRSKVRRIRRTYSSDDAARQTTVGPGYRKRSTGIAQQTVWKIKDGGKNWDVAAFPKADRGMSSTAQGEKRTRQSRKQQKMRVPRCKRHGHNRRRWAGGPFVQRESLDWVSSQKSGQRVDVVIDEACGRRGGWGSASARMGGIRGRRRHGAEEDDGGASLLALPLSSASLDDLDDVAEEEHVPSALPLSCRLRILGDTTGLERRKTSAYPSSPCTSSWHMYTTASCGTTSTSASTSPARCFPPTSATRSNADRCTKDTGLRRPKQVTVREEAGVLIQCPSLNGLVEEQQRDAHRSGTRSSASLRALRRWDLRYSRLQPTTAHYVVLRSATKDVRDHDELKSARNRGLTRTASGNAREGLETQWKPSLGHRHSHCPDSLWAVAVSARVLAGAHVGPTEFRAGHAFSGSSLLKSTASLIFCIEMPLPTINALKITQTFRFYGFTKNATHGDPAKAGNSAKLP
ncbi:hypothetical protein B0H13DRAFT_1914636 [Mycena leptocephala]|nr:hypothetical protein B0H13DRAFT_1914636 [Mycena leptocephala]